MAKFVGLATIALVGVMLAAAWKNPKGVAAASSGIKGIETPVLDSMLGQAP